MSANIKLNLIGHVTATANVTSGGKLNDNYEKMSSPEEDIYESVSPRDTPEPTKGFKAAVSGPAEDPQGYLVPYPDGKNQGATSHKVNTLNRSGIPSMYEDLWQYAKQGNNSEDNNNADAIYDEVETLIPSSLPPGAKIIPVEEPASAYDEVIINDGRYIIPSRQWDSDSDAFESDFDDDAEPPNYFGENLEALYENLEYRKLASPTPRTLPYNVPQDHYQTLKSQRGILGGCLPFSKSSKASEKPFDKEEAPLYVDPNNLGEKEPVMPPLHQDLSTEEEARYEIVQKILKTEATYKDNLNKLVQIEQELRERKLSEDSNLDVIFCSLQSILQSHEMFSMVLAARMNEWTVEGKLADIICASFSKSTTTMAYTDFVNNFLDAIDTFRVVCKNNTVFCQFVQVKINEMKAGTTFHDLMLKPFERFPEFIILIQDLLEVTPVGHVDRVPLQLALTQLECLAELVNSRRKESEMKTQLKYLDTQISQLNKPLSSSGRIFIRQDDMIHCLIDGVSVVGTKKLRLVLLSDMLLCLSPVGKKKRIVSGLLNTPKYKFKLKWNVPLSDVEFVEYGAGVSVAAGKYGTITTYSDEGKYRQASAETQKRIEDLQHDLAVIGQISGLASSLRGEHQLLDQLKVERWYKSVQNTITEELKNVNMYWLELSLPTKSGQHNYVFNLSSSYVKEEWQTDAMNAKLALESRNNPGWYLPDDDLTGSLSVLRRNMPLLAELFDLFIFNTKSRIEHTITYPMKASRITATTAARNLGYYVWISARGEMQGHVSVARFERNACVPRFVESFNVCPGTVYSMAHIPAMNSRPDQCAERYHTKYGFPFPTVWLGSHSSKIYIYDAVSDDRSRPLMELKLRDAPLAMKYAMRKVYVGLANGTLAIFRSNSSDHWNLVQPSILPLGRYPVAVIADVKDKLWCSSGSQIYVVSKKGDRIQRIIAVDSKMKNLVKHVVSCGVGVWVSVWKKATIKLYHAETYDMIQEVNAISPVVKMKSDVDSQVQYLNVEKVSVTALLSTAGFLWVGTSVGLILLYPLPKMQGVPRVIGRACVAFHAHSGPVRCLFSIPQGDVFEETGTDDMSTADEDPNEIDRKFSMLADSEESVESDEDFYFVDDKSPSQKGKKLPISRIKTGNQRVKATVQGLEQLSPKENDTGSGPAGDSEDFDITKPDDFARMMSTFDGFNHDASQKSKENDQKNVRSYKNKLFADAYPAEGKHNAVQNVDDAQVQTQNGNKTAESNTQSEATDNRTNPDLRDEGCKQVNSESNNIALTSTNCCTDNSSDSASGLNQNSDPGICAKNLGSIENEATSNGSTSTSNPEVTNSDAPTIPMKDEQIVGDSVLTEEKNDHGITEKNSDDINQEMQGTPTQPFSVEQSESEDIKSSAISSSEDCTSSETMHEKEESKPAPIYDFPKSSASSKTIEKSQETYVTVLASSTEQSTGGNDSKSDNDVRTKEELDNDPNNRFNKTGKPRAKCLSYLVVSGGEGDVDLRLKVKSKQDLKKDVQTMFLIWRVNSKI